MSMPKGCRTAIAWMLAAFFLGGSTVANELHVRAKARHLQGSYGLTTLSMCLRAQPHPPSVVGMDPVTRQLLLPAEATTQSGSGVMHFFRDGRARLEGTATEVDLNQNNAGNVPSIPGLTLVCSGTHRVEAGNRFVLQASCRVSIPGGPSFDVAPVEAEGFIAEDDRSIELVQKDNIQTISFALPDGNTLISERVCAQRFSLEKVF